MYKPSLAERITMWTLSITLAAAPFAIMGHSLVQQAKEKDRKAMEKVLDDIIEYELSRLSQESLKEVPSVQQAPVRAQKVEQQAQQADKPVAQVQPKEKKVVKPAEQTPPKPAEVKKPVQKAPEKPTQKQAASVVQKAPKESKLTTVLKSKRVDSQAKVDWSSAAVHAQLKQDFCSFFYDMIVAHEGQKGYLHLCTKGCKSIGRGCNVDEWKNFVKLDFPSPKGGLMNEKEKKVLFDRITADQKQILKEGWYTNCMASYYAKRWSAEKGYPRPTAESINRLEHELVEGHYDLLNKHLRDGLHRDISHFVTDQMFLTKNYKDSLVTGMMDIQYNTGGFCRKDWSLCYNALQKADQAYEAGNMANFKAYITKAAEQTHRTDKKKGPPSKGIQKRNKWTYDCFKGCQELNCSPATKVPVNNIVRTQTGPVTRAAQTR